MLLITPNMNFNGTCEKAIHLYEKAFGATLKVFLRYSDADPGDMKEVAKHTRNYVYHAELWIGKQRIMMCDRIDMEPRPGTSSSLVVTFETAPEVRAAYEILSEGGTVLSPMTRTTYSSCFVSLVDRFGMRWELMTEQTER